MSQTVQRKAARRFLGTENGADKMNVAPVHMMLCEAKDPTNLMAAQHLHHPFIRPAQRRDIPQLKDIRAAVRENILSDPRKVTRADTNSLWIII
jgi:hypothetical protein